MSSQSSHYHQEVLLAQFSLYVHKGGLKPDTFHLYVRYIRTHHYSYYYKYTAKHIDENMT